MTNQDEHRMPLPEFSGNDRGIEMKTIVTITVESEEKGTRIKISHEGDSLDYNDGGAINGALNEYRHAVFHHAKAEESLPVMKEKRKAMKQRVKDTAAYIEEFQTVGRLNECKEDDIPF